MIERKTIGVGSIWSIYAAINNSMRKIYRVKMNTWEELRRLLINITKWYIKKTRYFAYIAAPQGPHRMF